MSDELSSSPFGDIRIQDDARSDPGEVRSEGARDYDRVLYSSAFRRLAGVTQVISARDEYVLHDRSMHSLKVAQVAYLICLDLNRREADNLTVPLDPNVTSAAALAHDLGHPPFGHAAETELQQILAAPGTNGDSNPLLRDTFEGNAQTFRIVTKLAARKPEERRFLPAFDGTVIRTKIGLNLTWRTYAAILKYPWMADRQPTHLRHLHKWGAYDSERQFLEISAQRTRDLGVWHGTRSIEAEVMDWADDVAYAVHDTEDFFRAEQIPLARLKRGYYLVHASRQGESEWWRLVLEIEPIVKDVIDRLPGKTWSDSEYEQVCRSLPAVFPDDEYSGSTESREQLHQFASESIRRLTQNISVKNGSLDIPTATIIRAEVMKKLTKRYVVNRPDLLFEQQGQRRLVRSLFTDLHSLTKNAWIGGDRDAKVSMPSRLFEYCTDVAADPFMDVYGTDQARLGRAVVDFMCSLTDRQALLLAKRLSGDLTSTGMRWTSV